MRYANTDTAENRDISGLIRRLSRRVLLSVVALLLLVAANAGAQNGRWDWSAVTYRGPSKHGTRLFVDRWGHTHVVWVAQSIWSSLSDWNSQDPNNSRAGYQLFYSSDASGVFSAPIQATEAVTSGSLFLRTNQPAPVVFQIDQQGAVHLAYLANSDGHPSLFYTSNALGAGTMGQNVRRQFITDKPPITDLALSTDTLGFDMAVDTLGSAHFTWVEWVGSVAKVYYTSPREFWQPLQVAEFECSGMTGACRVGKPDIEVDRRGRAVIVVRNVVKGAGGIRLIRQNKPGVFDTPRWLQAFPYGDVLDGAAASDLRVRMAIDSSNRIHLVLPYVDRSTPGRNRLLYVMADTTSRDSALANDPANVIGDARPLTDAPLDAAPLDFDISYNAGDRIVVGWTTRTTGAPVRIGFAELAPAGQLPVPAWQTTAFSMDALGRFGSNAPLWKDEIRVGMSGDRIVLGGLHEPRNAAPSEKGVSHVAIVRRTSIAPRIRYIHPDAAAPGMNVGVEVFAHTDERGSFGRDTLGGAAVELANPGDAARVIVGPTVVSWDGRLASAMIFVKPGAAAGPVPLRVRVGSSISNVDTFYVVNPSHVGNLSGGGFIAAPRSRRGVMVVDSLILSAGVFKIDTADTDPLTPGNQGFLPVTILASGPVRIETNATLSVSAFVDPIRKVTYAGPGGGGGGTGGLLTGGSGYTGGGGVVFQNGRWLMGNSTGAGSEHSGFWNGGGGLNGVPGGISFFEAPSGGGTGHPFGASGLFGQILPTMPVERDTGGYAGGTAGGNVYLVSINSNVAAGGGGGGNASNGVKGSDNSGLNHDNAGRAVGSRQLVPFAGGSGGGGGASSALQSNGGSGGGAISIVSFGGISVFGAITADGCDGIGGSNRDAGGGGGSGGSIMLAAVDSVFIGPLAQLSVNGGNGGRSELPGAHGGAGGIGRIRVDGRVAGGGAIDLRNYNTFNGPGGPSGSSMQARQYSVITGYATPDSMIAVWKYAEGSTWTSSAWRKADAQGVWRDTLTAADAARGRLYVVAMQRVNGASNANFAYQPSWVMSPSSAVMIGLPKLTVANDTVDFGCIHYTLCKDTDVVIANPGDLGDLVLSNIRIEGPDSARFVLSNARVNRVVRAGTSDPITISFCPGGKGVYQAELVMETNLSWQPQRRIRLEGCGTSGLWSPTVAALDLGRVCPGQCSEQRLTVTNSGNAPLVVGALGFDPGVVSASIISGATPAIAPGTSRAIVLRLCPKRFVPDSMVISLAGNSVDGPLTVIARAANARPQLDIPFDVDFGKVFLGGAERCSTATIVIRNLSTVVPMRISNLETSSPQFTILSPAPGSYDVAPGGFLPVNVTFCPGIAGVYGDVLRMQIVSDDCRTDTVVQLRGIGAERQARYVIEEPGPSIGTLQFAPTLVGETSPRREIVIRNVGDAEGDPISATVSDGASEFSVETNTIRGIPAGDVARLGVVMHPTAAGIRSGRVELSSVQPIWGDAVLLNGLATQPGLQIDASVIDLGEICVGEQSSPATLEISNNGTSPATITGMAHGGRFLVSGLPVAFPYALVPGQKLHIEFRALAVDEGPIADELVIEQGGGMPFRVTLTAQGIRGHLLTSQSAFDMGCIPTGDVSRSMFVLTNTGKCPLTVSGFTGLDNGFFEISPSGAPIVLQPGQQQSYTVQYQAGTADAFTTVSVVSNAPEAITLSLTGRVCNSAERRFAIALPSDATAAVGDTFSLPVVATLTPAASFDLSYAITLSYAYDLLVPRIGARYDAVPIASLASGTISDAVAMEEITPGRLLLTGTIRAGATSGVLARIPMKVLLGSTYATPIAVAGLQTQPAMLYGGQNGFFRATGCDTAGVVVTGNYLLRQNVPNPFHPSTVISYTIARQERVVLNLYDASGALIRTLFDAVQPAGSHEFHFDASGIPSGVYTYEIVSGRYRAARRMVLTD